MRTFSRTSQFKKDVKRAEKRGKDLTRLKAVIELLIEGEILPPECKDHALRGEFKGSRDCHIEPDWILIYSLIEMAHTSVLSEPAPIVIYFASRS